MEKHHQSLTSQSCITRLSISYDRPCGHDENPALPTLSVCDIERLFSTAQTSLMLLFSSFSLMFIIRRLRLSHPLARMQSGHVSPLSFQELGLAECPITLIDERAAGCARHPHSSSTLATALTVRCWQHGR